MDDTAPMDRIVTLADRKAAAAGRRQRAVAELRRALDAYADAHGGRGDEVDDEVDEGFAVFGLGGRVFCVSRLHVEHFVA